MKRTPLVGAISAAALLIPTLSLAATIDIRSNEVVPIKFEDEISMKDRRGDRFSVSVNDDRMLPRGTRLNGKIVNIQKKRDNRPAYIDMEFTEIVLPDGTRKGIRAVPISMSDRYVQRNREGRFEARTDNISKDKVAIGGAVGGLILGSIFKKPFEGAFLGAIAGIVLAETGALNNGDVVVKRGATMGALFERDLRVEYRGRWDDRYYGDDDWSRRDDEWYRRDDDRNRRDDDYRYDDRYDNRYGNDVRVQYDGREIRYGRNEMPFRQGDTVMVPLIRTADHLNLDVQRNGSRAYFVEDDENSLRIEQDSTSYRLNGRRGTLSRAVIERSGVIYVPIEIFAAMKDRPLLVNGNRIYTRA